MNPILQAKSDDAGFTLLELLVAITILSLSAVILFGIFSQALDRTHRDLRQMEARGLAQSLLAEAESNPPSADSRGITDSGFAWKLHVQLPAEEGTSVSGPRPEIISATVFWKIDADEKSLALTTVAIRPKEIK
jgi:general secretion pathway protein I